jgi:hypothetical protein
MREAGEDQSFREMTPAQKTGPFIAFGATTYAPSGDHLRAKVGSHQLLFLHTIEKNERKRKRKRKRTSASPPPPSAPPQTVP